MTMRRMMILGLAGLAVGCADETALRPTHTVRDSAGVRIVESVRPEVGDSSGWYVDSIPILDLTRPDPGGRPKSPTCGHPKLPHLTEPEAP